MCYTTCIYRLAERNVWRIIQRTWVNSILQTFNILSVHQVWPSKSCLGPHYFSNSRKIFSASSPSTLGNCHHCWMHAKCLFPDWLTVKHCPLHFRFLCIQVIISQENAALFLLRVHSDKGIVVSVFLPLHSPWMTLSSYYLPIFTSHIYLIYVYCPQAEFYFFSLPHFTLRTVKKLI